MTWVVQYHWPGLEMAQEMAQGWVLHPHIMSGSNMAALYSPQRSHNRFPLIKIHDCSVNKCFTLSKVQPLLLTGHPGFDNFSGAFLHVKIRAVQTLPKVSLTTSHFRKSRKKRMACVKLHLVLLCCNHLSAVRTLGSHLKTWPTWSTTPSSHQRLASQSDLKTQAK